MCRKVKKNASTFPNQGDFLARPKGPTWRTRLTYCVGVGHGKGCHVDDAANGGAWRQNVYWLGRPQEHRAYRNVATCRCFQQVVRNIGSIDVWQDQNFGHLVLFTPDFYYRDEDGPRMHAVAIEPQTGGANAFNTGEDLIHLEAGRPWAGTWGFTIRE